MDENLGPKTIYMVREVYDCEDAPSKFARELDQALTNKFDIIVIEPLKLADIVTRWISLGNLVHKAAVVFGFTSVVTYYLWPSSGLISFTALSSCLCTSVYTFSWKRDPCSMYQVVDDNDLAGLGPPFPQIIVNSFPRPIVIAKFNDRSRKILQWTASSLAILCFTLGYIYED